MVVNQVLQSLHTGPWASFSRRTGGDTCALQERCARLSVHKTLGALASSRRIQAELLLIPYRLTPGAGTVDQTLVILSSAAPGLSDRNPYKASWLVRE